MVFLYISYILKTLRKEYFEVITKEEGDVKFVQFESYEKSLGKCSKNRGRRRNVIQFVSLELRREKYRLIIKEILLKVSVARENEQKE